MGLRRWGNTSNRRRRGYCERPKGAQTLRRANRHRPWGRARPVAPKLIDAEQRLMRAAMRCGRPCTPAGEPFIARDDPLITGDELTRTTPGCDRLHDCFARPHFACSFARSVQAFRGRPSRRRCRQGALPARRRHMPCPSSACRRGTRAGSPRAFPCRSSPSSRAAPSPS